MRCRPPRVHPLLLAFILAAGICGSAAAFPAAEKGSSARNVSGFDGVELSILGELILTQGNTESLEIEASSSDLERISTVVRGGTLQIGQVNPGPGPRGPVTYRLTMRKISGLFTNSSGSIRAASIETDSLRITIYSSGSISINQLTARALDVTLQSSGSCTIAGTVDRQAVRLNSRGEYRAENLSSREASVEASSNGSATVRVSEILDTRISSNGDVRYRGNPTRVTSNASSSGRLIKLD